MLKRLVNSATFEFVIDPIDPLLIKSGQASVGGVDMAFVRTYKFGREPEPYLPGTSLKGMIRAYSEKICRTLRADPVPVCLPYVEPDKVAVSEKGQAGCGHRITRYMKCKEKDSIPTSDTYRISCPACRTFGSLQFIGRVSTSDAYLSDEFRKRDQALLETRDGIAIDRRTGGVAGGAKFDLEVLTKGQFSTRLEIHNFERWQLGLLGLVLRDLQEGNIRLGLGKSRGLGRVKAEDISLRVSYYNAQVKHLAGLWCSATEIEREAYGLFAEKQLGANLPDPVRSGLRFDYDLTQDWKGYLEPAVEDLVEYISTVPWPELMDTYLRGG